MESIFKNIPGTESSDWKDPVTTFSNLPSSGELGEVRLVIDEATSYYWDGDSWEPIIGTTGGVTSVNSQVGAVILDTDDIPEGTAQYFTDERAQDAVGTILTDTASIDLTYNDGTPSISAIVLPAGVDHNALQNYVANQHIDHSTVSISAGTGLSGGGDITTNRTISMPSVGTPGTYGSATQVPVLTTDIQGRITAVTPTTIAIPSTAITDFTEAAQDAVGTALTDTASIDLNYSDVGNTVSATVLPAGVDHNSLQNYEANRHIDHSAVSISAGTGLAGGGDITTNRTLDLADTTVTPGSYTSANLTVDAQGRLTAASSGLQLVALSANQATTLSTPVDVTGLSFTLATNSRYYYKFNIVTQTSSVNQAVRHAVTFSGTSAVFAARSEISSGTSGTGANFMNLLASSGATSSGPSMGTVNVPQYGSVEGVIVTSGTGGTLQLQFFIETAGNTATMLEGSNGQLWTLP